ncbi:tetratricopeptide repeat protein [Streptomyces sp. NPDC047860]|uniref:tetratricopeptide repeat protein n=1 Tax=Streptomyces sp. NPDC047860 TaxID=3155743 RepID=UPI0033DBF60D
MTEADNGRDSTAEGDGWSASEEPSVFEQRNCAHPGASLYAVQHGDMHIRNGHPVYHVEPFRAAPPPLPYDAAATRPSRLLAAEHAVVAFTGRRTELADLAAWRDGEASGLSVKLVHGPGGQGKTRLAARFAADSAEQGWTVWAAHHLSDPTALTAIVPGDSGPRLLVIVEYAERWPADDLQLLLGNPLLRHPERARVLLLARPAASWWPSLRHRLRSKLHLDVAHPLELKPITSDPALRGELVAAAREQFAAALGVPLPDIGGPGPEAWEGPDFDLVLNLHMAALVAVHSNGRSNPADPAELSAYLLDREHDFWQTLHDHDRIATPPRRMARTSYLATLTRPLASETATTVLTQTGAATAQDAATTLSDHTACYPSAQPDTRLEPLYPDRLGEDFVALQTPGHAMADYFPDDWAAQAPASLLAPTGPALTEAAAPLWSRPALTVLIETSLRWRHVAEQQLYPLLTAHPRLALAAGGAALARIIEIDGVDFAVLSAIEPHLPTRSVDLAPATAAIRRVLTNDRLQRTDDPSERADLHVTLAFSLLEVGLAEEALAEITKATVIYRRLAPTTRVHQMALTEALRLQATVLSDLGRHEEAVDIADSALLIFRNMQPMPAPYAQVCASLLHTLGIALSDLGRYDRALEVAREALRLRRELAEDDSTAEVSQDSLLGSPDRLLAELADAMTALGNRLWSAGRRVDAVEPAMEAVGIYRTLADAAPDVWEPGLAVTLNNLAIRYHGLGRHEHGLAPAQEAVEIRRRHVRTNRRAHLPVLADTLDNLANLYSGLGQRERAHALTHEAVVLYQEAAAANPTALAPDLAIALNNLATRLNELGRYDEALHIVKQAFDLASDLARAHPDAHLPVKGKSLLIMGRALLQLGRHDEAVTRIEEGVAAFRKCAEAIPEAALPDLAVALNNLGATLSDIGHLELALPLVQEAIGTLGLLPPENRGAHLPLFEALLRHLGSLLYRSWNFDAAVPVAQQRVHVCRILVQMDAVSYEPYIAAALVDLGNALGAAGHYAQSLDAMQEGLQMYACLYQADPERALPGSWGPPTEEGEG